MRAVGKAAAFPSDRECVFHRQSGRFPHFHSAGLILGDDTLTARRQQAVQRQRHIPRRHQQPPDKDAAADKTGKDEVQKEQGDPAAQRAAARYDPEPQPPDPLDDILWLVDQLKARFGDKLPPVRINTNGHANLILGRDVCPELKGRIDTVSISLNAITAQEYVALCHPVQGEAAYQAMLDFARESKQYVPHVILTIVDKDKTPEEIQTCKDIARDLGVKLRIRSFIDS